MGAGKRFILAFLGIIALACSVFIILATLGVLNGTALYSLLSLYRIEGNLHYTALGFLVLLIGVAFLAFSMQGSSKKEGGTIISFTETGEVRISFKAIENMVLTASRKINGVCDHGQGVRKRGHERGCQPELSQGPHPLS